MGISRKQLWIALGFLKPGSPTMGFDLDKLTDEAYDDLSWEMLKTGSDDSPHGQPWHTSFHASGFPSEKRACARKAMYEMMGVPPEKPAQPWLVAVADAGKDIETQIVRRWERMGWLLTAAPDSPLQTNFEDRQHWLTCSLDSALDLRDASGYAKVLPVDVKGKDHDVVTQISYGKREPDEGHVRQVLVQTMFCRTFHAEMGWKQMGLEMADGAVLLYVSRQRPGHRAVVWVPWDEERMKRGLAVLGAWKAHFLDGTLPARPRSWQWTQEPCKWCDHADVCKFDLRNEVTRLEDSAGIAKAQSVRPGYDFAKAREAVLGRWNKRPKGAT